VQSGCMEGRRMAVETSNLSIGAGGVPAAARTHRARATGYIGRTNGNYGGVPRVLDWAP